ncbi:13970_t:CDS:2 [Entrophospora sp. SA101]|nr:12064_t:CDS:2 [Entrophospora sp. SA101]CAJ0634404.1 978_t:CDS:2 [Entrophospora sp. SA101]CAJ0747206.1 13970_t:CDS:2 [Entrophospora sp. SA101]CAJ0826840.1 8539_t:CDS:2 [Entrophospora sp. SA101]CAJ0848971.1 4085_t:CDS:2 [Entrophospora sp. SA101]
MDKQKHEVGNSINNSFPQSGISLMPGPITSLPPDQEKIFRAEEERSKNKKIGEETGTTEETEIDLSDGGKIKEYEQPSYTSGTKNEAIGIAMGKDHIKNSGKEEKKAGEDELKRTKAEDNIEQKFEILE